MSDGSGKLSPTAESFPEPVHPYARRWIWLAVIASALLVVTYLGAVWTVAGQRFENAGLRGADRGDHTTFLATQDSLSTVTVALLIVMSVGVGIIVLLRRRFDLLLAAAVIVGGSLVITEVLKRFVLPRPDLVGTTEDFYVNSFPSGHTTIAMSLLVVLLLVVPYSLRGITMFLAIPVATGIAAYTITAQWHRVSDTFGADLVVLIVAACVCAWLIRRKGVVWHPRTRVSWCLILVVLPWALAAAVAWAFGVILGLFTGDLTTSAGEYNAYLAANTLALAGSLTAALLFWAGWYRVELREDTRASTAQIEE